MDWMKASAAALALALATTPAVAQNVRTGNVNAGNLITVDLTVVAQNIANNLKVDISQIPVTVQVPVGIAANVCNVEANILARGGEDGDSTCDAENTSSALNRIVQRQM